MAPSRARTPQIARAERVARALYPDLAAVQWVPSDEADVFRLAFSSARTPRFLKLPIEGIGAVWREVRMLPVLRSMGFPVPELERSTADHPDAGTEFHVTLEAEHVAGADLTAPAAVRLAAGLGPVVRRLEALDARDVPGSCEWSRDDSEWWRPQYRSLLDDHRWPTVARDWAERILARLDSPPDAFGGWFGEMLIARDGSFLMIDWTCAGASWAGAQAAIAMEVLAGFGTERRRELIHRFIEGYAPAGIRRHELEALRLWTVHGTLGWAMLSPPTDHQIRLAVDSTCRCLDSDDPADWF